MTPATPARDDGADPILVALRARGARIRRVRYRANRTVLLSVSADGRTLNSHACFRGAPAPIVEAIARYLTARSGSAAARRALRRLRQWDGTRRGLEAARAARPRRSRPAVNTPETAPLRTLFDRFNARRFDSALPAVPLRISRRMTRSLGTIRYGGPEGEARERTVTEIAIAADLLLPVNRARLEDTLLHEMAHAEAWLRHGHRGHGPVWRRIAERVGCTPRARCRAPVARFNGRSG